MFTVLVVTPPELRSPGGSRKHKTSTKARVKNDYKTRGSTSERFRFARFLHQSIGALTAFQEIECHGWIKLNVSEKGTTLEGCITAWNLASEEIAEQTLTEILSNAKHVAFECTECSCKVEYHLERTITSID